MASRGDVPQEIRLKLVPKEDATPEERWRYAALHFAAGEAVTAIERIERFLPADSREECAPWCNAVILTLSRFSHDAFLLAGFAGKVVGRE